MKIIFYIIASFYLVYCSKNVFEGIQLHFNIYYLSQLIVICFFAVKVYEDIQDFTLKDVFSWIHTLFPFILLLLESKSIYSNISLFFVYFGSLLLLYSLLSLNSAFRVNIAIDTIKTKGAYQFIRHPIYLSHMIILFGLICENLTLLSTLYTVLYIFITVLRIEKEEDMLGLSKKYMFYKRDIKFKLIPFVY